MLDLRRLACINSRRTRGHLCQTEAKRSADDVVHRDAIASGLAPTLAEDGDVRPAVRADLNMYLRTLAVVLGLCPHRL